MKKQLAACIAAFTILFAGCAKAQTAWITDIDAAAADAGKSKKDLLIAFTGSDWNDPSKELFKTVFTEEFFKQGSKDYVLCNIDIVQDETLMDKGLIEANYAVASKYGVQELPYFVIQTSEGDMYAGTGANETTVTADSLLAYLGTYADARKKITDLKSLIKSTKGTEKALNIDLFIEAMDPSRREKYSALIREVPSLDADGTAGLRGKYQLQTAYLDAIALSQDKKLAEAGDQFLKIAGGGTLNAAQEQEAWYMGAYMYAMSETVDNAKVIEWLGKAVEADPDNEGSAQISETIEQLKKAPPKKTDK